MQLSDVTEELLRSIDIHNVLPQQEPFVMVDTLTKFKIESSTTETTVRDSNIFVENGMFSESGTIENIAQTCASRIGFYNKYILLKDVQVGYIGAVRDFRISRKAKVGEMLTTTVDVLEEIFGMTLASAKVCVGEETIATAQIKLAVKNNG